MLLAALLLAGCGDDRVPAASLGARLVADPALSPSPFNAFSCATCHPVTVGPVDGGPIYPGWNLFDVAHRPGWWGGNVTRLLDAMNTCLVEFMGGAALDAGDEKARAIYEYLVSISPEDPAPAMPLTVVKNVNDLAALAPTADATRGAEVYARGCRGCHGEPHSGDGRLGPKTTIVPEETLTGPVCAPASNVRACARAVVVEKVRHGKFFNIGGLMPLYAAELMSDAEIADVLAYLEL